MKKPRPSVAFLSEKRARKADRRRAHQFRIWREGHVPNANAPGWVGWPSDSYLHALGRCALDKPAGPRLAVEIPATFSIIEAPELAIQTIGLVARAAGRDDVSEIYFDHRAVKQYDLAAEAIAGHGCHGCKKSPEGNPCTLEIYGRVSNRFRCG
jgi:hypothetical protein